MTIIEQITKLHTSLADAAKYRANLLKMGFTVSNEAIIAMMLDAARGVTPNSNANKEERAPSEELLLDWGDLWEFPGENFGPPATELAVRINSKTTWHDRILVVLSLRDRQRTREIAETLCANLAEASELGVPEVRGRVQAELKRIAKARKRRGEEPLTRESNRLWSLTLAGRKAVEEGVAT